MKLVLDNIIFSLQTAGGISVYWSEIIKRLLKDPHQELEFIETLSSQRNIFRAKLKISPNQIVSQNKLPLAVTRYCSAKSNELSPGVFHSSYYRTPNKISSFKQVVTVHDFTYEKFVTGVKKKLHTWQKKNAIASADVVICVSESTKKDLLHYYPEFSKKKIIVIYNGVSDDYFPIDKFTPNEVKPYLLFVGSRAFYKNFEFAVDIINQLPYMDLVIVGNPLFEYETKLLQSKIGGRYKVLSKLSNEEMNRAYNGAFALLYPSLYEGFGIPVVEAMKAGCPVITLNNSSLPEVCGNAGVMVTNLNVASFTAAIKYVESNRSMITKAGIDQASIFSWEKCYRSTLDAYEHVATYY